MDAPISTPHPWRKEPCMRAHRYSPALLLSLLCHAAITPPVIAQTIVVVRTGEQVPASDQKAPQKVVGMRETLRFEWPGHSSFTVYVIPEDMAGAKYTDPDGVNIGEPLRCPKSGCQFTLTAVGADLIKHGKFYVLAFRDSTQIGKDFTVRAVEYVGLSVELGVPGALAIPLDGGNDFAAITGVGVGLRVFPPSERLYMLSQLKLLFGGHRFALGDADANWALSVGLSFADKLSITYARSTSGPNRNFLLLGGTLAKIVEAGNTGG